MSDEDVPSRDVLWKMYQEHCTQGRHHKTQRSTVVSAVMAVSSAIISVALYTLLLPATWSLMLALRARGIGSAWTTLHTVSYAQEVATLLEIPEDIQQVVLLPVAYYTGEDFKPAKRIPAGERTYWDTWGKTR